MCCGWGYKPQEHNGAGCTPRVAWEGCRLGRGQPADGEEYLGSVAGVLALIVSWKL